MSFSQMFLDFNNQLLPVGILFLLNFYVFCRKEPSTAVRAGICMQVKEKL